MEKMINLDRLGQGGQGSSTNYSIWKISWTTMSTLSTLAEAPYSSSILKVGWTEWTGLPQKSNKISKKSTIYTQNDKNLRGEQKNDNK